MPFKFEEPPFKWEANWERLNDAFYGRGPGLVMNETIKRLLRERAIGDDHLIATYLKEHPGVQLSDLALHRYPGGRTEIHVITKAERWLDWHSDNHGWGSY